MTDFTAAYSEITQIAPELNCLPAEEDAELRYVLMWDGLLWSDELPKKMDALGDSSVIGFLIRYRTMLILGTEKEGTWPVWEAAKRAFPNWPGFAPERCRYDKGLCLQYEELSSEAWADCEDDGGGSI